MINKKIVLFLLLGQLVTIKMINAQYLSANQIIENRVEASFNNQPVFANNKILFSQIELSKFYSNRNFQLAWKDKRNRHDLLASIISAREEGLLSEDYHLEEILNLMKKSNYKDLNNIDLAEFDLFLTDALIFYASHLVSGKVDQSKLRTEWDLEINKRPKNVDSLLTVALANQNIKENLEKLKPESYFYKNLKLGLKKYREIETNGGWNKIEEGETLKKGMVDERIISIRKYLKITEDLSKSSMKKDSLFDEELENAVKHFQFRHNLTQDGFIGKGTLKQMNISVEERINMIRLNMERGRWLLHQPSDDFLIINIAGFIMRRIKNNEIVFESRVIVGKNHKESPIFKDELEYFVLNPTWTLPYSIATHETLPKLKKDTGYLAAKHMEIMDRNGNVLNPDDIDFSQYSVGKFPFIIRQKAGKHNALGQVKFIFPNKYAVYVHDTPSRGLFNKQDRAFSHGCIRLENKWGLLMNLMDQPDIWNMDKINEILESGVTTRVNLKKPVDIYILYWTAGSDKDKKLFFERDVYNRDTAVLNSLNKPALFKTIN